MNKYATQTWEDCLLEAFVDTVKAPYADFSAIERLITATQDDESLQQIVEVLSHYPQAKYAFQERLMLGEVDLQQLQCLSPTTFGYAYAEHMLGNGLKPINMQANGNSCNYVITHLTETHDIWHVITGCDTSMAGEIQLQAFVAAQLKFSRFSLVMLAKNLVKTAIHAIDLAEQRLDAIAWGWTMGKQARPLFGVQWNTLWNMPLEQLQSQFNILPCHDSTRSSQSLYAAEN